MYTYIHTYIHIHIDSLHTHSIHIHTLKHPHVHTYTGIHTCIHTHLLTAMDICMHACRHYRSAFVHTCGIAACEVRYLHVNEIHDQTIGCASHYKHLSQLILLLRRTALYRLPAVVPLEVLILGCIVYTLIAGKLSFTPTFLLPCS